MKATPQLKKRERFRQRNFGTFSLYIQDLYERDRERERERERESKTERERAVNKNHG